MELAVVLWTALSYPLQAQIVGRRPSDSPASGLIGESKMNSRLLLLGASLLCAAPAFGTPKLYMTLQTEDKVAVVNTETDTLITTIPVGGMPHDVICSRDNKTVFVSNPMTDDTMAIDVVNDHVIHRIDLEENAVPWHVDVSLDGKWVYAAAMDQLAVAQMSAQDYSSVSKKIPFSHEPWAIASTPQKIYVTLNGSVAKGTVNAANLVGIFHVDASDPEVKYVKVGYGPHGLLASHDKRFVYVASQKDHEVWRINVSNDHSELFTRIPGDAPLAPGFPTDIAVSPDDNTVIAFNHDIDSMSFIDAASGKIIETVPTGEGSQPWGGIYSLDGSKVYVATNGYDTISVFDAVSRKFIKKIGVGKGADGMTICGL